MCRTLWLALGFTAILLGSCRSKPAFEGKSAEQLEEMLQDDDPQVQAQGAYGAGQDDDMARRLVPALTVAVRKGNVLVRQYAARALGRAGADAESAVPALTAALGDPAWTVRRQAALALGQIGPPARSAIPALRKLSGDSDQAVRQAAREAIQQIGHKKP
jgi:HEAT repeat protein